jgi:hypothetical protein
MDFYYLVGMVISLGSLKARGAALAQCADGFSSLLFYVASHSQASNSHTRFD